MRRWELARAAGKDRKARKGYTVATGPDPREHFEFKYRAVELGDLIASHTINLEPNQQFPTDLQPRRRERQASRNQIVQIAKNLDPAALLTDSGTLDRGPIIIGKDKVVESGNGRTIALQIAAREFPERFAAYQTALHMVAAQFGISRRTLNRMQQPVLVRERITPVNRARFVSLANQAVVLTMSPVENALQDASKLSMAAISTLTVAEGQGIDQALKTAANRSLVQRFLAVVPDNERATISDAHGQLNQLGLLRLKTAIFAKVFSGEAGRRLAETFFETSDSQIKTIENAIFDGLPVIAKAEALASTGQRAADLSLASDLAAVVALYSAVRQRNMSVSNFLSQGQIFNAGLPETQRRLLEFFEEFARSRKRLREFLVGYAQSVIASPSPRQLSMLAGEQITKQDLLRRHMTSEIEAGPLFAGLAANPRGRLLMPSSTSAARLLSSLWRRVKLPQAQSALARAAASRGRLTAAFPDRKSLENAHDRLIAKLIDLRLRGKDIDPETIDKALTLLEAAVSASVRLLANPAGGRRGRK